MADHHFDLAIVGGGPAGTSAAITAARAGARVIVFEAHGFPRHKVCGEFVSAESLDVLADLLPTCGPAESLLDICPVIARTRLWMGSRMVNAPVRPAALSISRYQLDVALWKAAQSAGAECRSECEVLKVEGSGPFHVKTSDGTASARALIVAAGRWSHFTPDRRIPPGPKWIGVKGHFREARPNRSTDLYFFNNGYCGVQPISDDVVNACAMVRSDRASTLPQAFALHPKLAARARHWTAVTQPVTTAPLVYRDPQPVQDSIAFAGDAAAFIDPFVGDGISLALRSGRVAGLELGQFISGAASLAASLEKYRAKYFRHFAPLHVAAAKVRSLLSLPVPARALAFELLRLPGVMPLVIRKTRRAA